MKSKQEKIEIEQKEKLISFLLDELKIKQNKESTVCIDKSDVSKIGMSIKEIITNIYILNADYYLTIKDKSPSDDFSRYWTVQLLSPCLHYFSNKKESKVIKRNHWIQFWIPVSISICALAASIVALIL
ncbi:hypothetical protein [Kineothrix sp. MB12-C1]|uniref:hypothetical protein n=1 Tax=Kineothrix sp. MB12-C1 TaxID=3070215 RepID=UPI0027D30B3A|nr:hypothetical protein [Kineothrix sp. MB12-C1]WMC93198.1 hypothetical protein RBB56_02630 [Kineothrix sp. MB12-C1]